MRWERLKKMTNEEAIVILKKLWCYEKTDYDDEEIRDAIDVAIKSVNKQIKKRPLPIRAVRSGRIVDYACPICNKPVIGTGYYCWNCGQHLMWR